jgi:4-amino-4-deoxy-L-arabinose transferase-like glycosyltransferase
MYKTNLSGAGIILVAACALFTSFLGARYIQLTNDSMRYALVSQNIFKGHGVKLPMTEFYGQLPDSSGKTHFLMQPPLYPILLGAMGGITPERLWPGKVINIISHIAITIICFLIAHRLCGMGPALAAGLATAFCVPLLYLCQFLWSESLFILFTAVCIWFLIMARSAKRAWFFIFGAGLFAVAAITTRFIGAALLPLFLWDAFVTWKKRADRTLTVVYGLGLLTGIVTLTVLFVRNYIICGTIRGFEQPDPQRMVLEALSGVFIKTQQQIGIINLAIIAAGMLTWFFIAAKKRDIAEVEIQKASKGPGGGIDLISVFISSYLILLIYAMTNYQPHFEKRFFVPIIPFVILAAVNSAEYIAVTSRLIPARHREFVRAGLLSLIVIYSAVSFGTKVSDMCKPVTNETFKQLQTFAWLREHVNQKKIITTNERFKLAFYGDYPVLQLPSRAWDSRKVVPKDMDVQLPRRMAKVKAEYLALFAQKDKFTQENAGEFVFDLYSNRSDRTDFELIYDGSDGVIYRLTTIEK